VFEFEQGIFIDRFNLDRSGLVIADRHTLDQEQDGHKANRYQDDIAVELHFITN